jgi:para-nitrobenzyl esterase
MKYNKSLADHTADIQYLFVGFHGGPEGRKKPLNHDQKELSDKLVGAWVHFAFSGNPNKNGETFWPEFRSQSLEKNVVYFLSQNIDKKTEAELMEDFKCSDWERWLMR